MQADLSLRWCTSYYKLCHALAHILGRIHTTYLIRINSIRMKLIRIKLRSHLDYFDADQDHPHQVAFTPWANLIQIKLMRIKLTLLHCKRNNSVNTNLIRINDADQINLDQFSP